MESSLRIALVQDWLTGMRGGEKVLEVLCELFPRATIYTLLHNKGSVSPAIESHEIRTSFIDRLPLKTTRYRHYLPLFPAAIESMNFQEYDLILSTSHCVAKAARPSGNALHICYCHTPMRYVWELYDEYFGPGRAGLLTRAAMAAVAPALRAWDVKTSSRVHYFLANSRNVAGRIQRYYQRHADVLCAPVDMEKFQLSMQDDGYYLIVSALVPYKRIDLAIEAFRSRQERLVIVGRGPESEKLKASAPRNVEFLGWQSDEDLVRLYARCHALLFPGVEDFGIVPLEAMACGKPIIAFGEGGALETVIGEGDGATGIFFQQQTVEALCAALEQFQGRSFDPAMIRLHAALFNRDSFKKNFAAYIEEKAGVHFNSRKKQT